MRDCQACCPSLCIAFKASATTGVRTGSVCNAWSRSCARTRVLSKIELQLTAVCGTVAGWMDKTDPFVEVSLGKEKYCTEIKQNAGGTVKFDEKMTFTKHADDHVLHIRVLDSDPLRNEVIASKSIDLEYHDLTMFQPDPIAFDMMTHEGDVSKVAGQVLLIFGQIVTPDAAVLGRKHGEHSAHPDADATNGRRHSTPDPQAPLIPREGILKKGTIEQKIVSSVVFWEPRHLIVTNTALVLSKTGAAAVVCDSIALHDVLRVFVQGDVSDQPTELVVRTDPHGGCFGRTYTWRIHDPEELQEWHEFLASNVKAARKRHRRQLEEEGGWVCSGGVLSVAYFSCCCKWQSPLARDGCLLTPRLLQG